MKVKPPKVGVAELTVGVSAAASELVEVLVTVPVRYSFRVVVIVATDAVLGETPVIVAKPFPLVPLKETDPPLVAVPAQV